MANEFDFESNKNAIDDVVANAEKAVGDMSGAAAAEPVAPAEAFDRPLYTTDPLTFGEDPATTQANAMAEESMQAQLEADRLREQLEAQQKAAREHLDDLRNQQNGPGPAVEEQPDFGGYTYEQQQEQAQTGWDDGYTYQPGTGAPNAANGPSYEVQPGEKAPGHNEALVSLVTGIVSIACWFFGVSSVISIACGIVGIVYGNKAKTMGNTETIRSVGFILSIIGLVGGVLVLVACVAIVGIAGCAAVLGG